MHRFLDLYKPLSTISFFEKTILQIRGIKFNFKNALIEYALQILKAAIQLLKYF